MTMSLTKVLTIFLLLATFIPTAHAQRLETPNSIGIRLGDPSGVTYKRYLPNHKAFEFALGSGVRGWYRSYYKNSFDHFSRYDNDRYLSHSVESTFAMLGRYLFHYDIPMDPPASEGTVEWYWGIGGMLRSAKVRYHYQENAPPQLVKNDTRNDITFGPEGIVGMEYTFEDVPLTLFGEVSLLIEIADRPGAVKFSGGTGARFNF